MLTKKCKAVVAVENDTKHHVEITLTWEHTWQHFTFSVAYYSLRLSEKWWVSYWSPWKLWQAFFTVIISKLKDQLQIKRVNKSQVKSWLGGSYLMEEVYEYSRTLNVAVLALGLAQQHFSYLRSCCSYPFPPSLCATQGFAEPLRSL